MKNKLFLLSIIATFIFACNNDIEINKIEKNSEPGAITINSFIPKMTKATDTNVDTLQKNGMCIFGYKSGTTDAFMDSVIFSYNATDQYWDSNPIYYWPDYPLDFYGYYPAVVDKNSTTPNVFNYTVNPVSTNQTDLVMAFKGNQSTPGTSNPLDLIFQHALSKINFVIELKANCGINIELYSIQLMDILSEGTFTYDTTAVAMPYFAVTNQSVKSNPTILPGILILDSSTTDVSSSVIGNLYLIPQSLNNWSVTQTNSVNMEGTYIYLTCQLSGVASYGSHIAVPITTTEWLPGYSYTYTIVFGGDGSTGGGGYNPDKPSPDNPDEPEQVLVPITINTTVETWVDVSPEPIIDL